MTKYELRELIRECLREELNNSSLKEDVKHIYYHADPGGLKRGQWLDVKEEAGRTLAKWSFDDNWRDITDEIEEMPYHNYHGARPAKTFTWGGWRFWLDDEVENFWDIEGKRIIGDFEIPGMPHVKRKATPEVSLTEGRRINYDDDLVVVYEDDKVIYKGLEDYEPMKDELWKWDDKEQVYFLDDRRYKKVCLESVGKSTLTEDIGNIKIGDKISYNLSIDPEERWEDALVLDISGTTVTVRDPYGAFGETAKLNFSDLIDVEVTPGVWYDLKKLETDDYQNRNGDYPRSGRPDTINVSSAWIEFSFKNTPQSVAERWVERYLNSEGFKVAAGAISSYQSGDYHDDWVDVSIQIHNISKM